MATETLAKTKMAKVSGGDVNYYLVVIDSNTCGRTPRFICIAEVEDIIEATSMEFAEACVFKAMVRKAKLRQDLGKPGSTSVYEAEKGVYYADRTLAKALRRLEKDKAFSPFHENPIRIEMDKVEIRIDQPKRLAPYTVDIDDFILALAATPAEAETIRSIVIVSMLQAMNALPSHQAEVAQKAADGSRKALAEAQAI